MGRPVLHAHVGVVAECGCADLEAGVHTAGSKTFHLTHTHTHATATLVRPRTSRKTTPAYDMFGLYCMRRDEAWDEV